MKQTTTLLCMLLGITLHGNFYDLSLQWQAAYQLEDARSALEISQTMLRQDNISPLGYVYQVRSLCLDARVEEAQQVWNEKIARQIKPPYGSEEVAAIGDMAWGFLRLQLQNASPDIWLFVCAQLSNIRERQVSDLVLLALEHSDLRVQLAALDLVARYPQDIYRSPILQLWSSCNHPVLRARILDICSNLRWPEAKDMQIQLSQLPQLSRAELVAVASARMLDQNFAPELICQMTQSTDMLQRRLGAWLLRFCPISDSELPTIYKKLFTSSDLLTLQLTLDSFATSHITLVTPLYEALLSLQARSFADINLQLQWLVAMHESPQAALKLWRSYLNSWKQSQAVEGMDSWPLAQLSSWLSALATHEPKILTEAWQERSSMPISSQISLAQGIISTRSNQPVKYVQESADVIYDWLQQKQDLWLQETPWISKPALFTQPPGWMPSQLVHSSAQQMRWQLLELLSFVQPQKSFNLAWKMSRLMPQQWNLSMLWMAWRLGLEAMPTDVQEERDQMWLKTVLLASQEDKQKLMQQWPSSDAWWKERIMDAMISQADAQDIPFLLQALGESSMLRIKSSCALLIAIRQGYRNDSK